MHRVAGPLAWAGPILSILFIDVKNLRIYIPLPNSEITCGLPVASWISMTLPRHEPATVGVKVTLKVQLAPAASDDTHLEAAKSPVAATPVIVNAALPVFVTVTVCAELGVPVVWFPKFKLAWDRPIAGAGALVPIPDKRIKWGLPAALSEMATEP
jgi:hypothetical protein